MSACNSRSRHSSHGTGFIREGGVTDSKKCTECNGLFPDESGPTGIVFSAWSRRVPPTVCCVAYLKLMRLEHGHAPN
jgi:hypothetical protein